MSKDGFPKEITNENLSQLVERAKGIKRKGNTVIRLTGIIYSLVGWLAAPLLFFLSAQLVVRSYTPATLPNFSTLNIFVLVTFFVMYAAFSLYFFMFLEYFIRKIAKLGYDEWVFSECVMIVDSLNRNNKEDAIKEVDGFLSSLNISQNTSGYNSKAKRYAPEIKLLYAGRNSIKRMLLFSTENVSELFASFGLALINNDDPKAYSNLRYMISEAKSYGKLEGWFQRIESQARSLKTVLTSISIVIAIVTGLITILKLVGLI